MRGTAGDELRGGGGRRFRSACSWAHAPATWCSRLLDSVGGSVFSAVTRGSRSPSDTAARRRSRVRDAPTPRSPRPTLGRHVPLLVRHDRYLLTVRNADRTLCHGSRSAFASPVREARPLSVLRGPLPVAAAATRRSRLEPRGEVAAVSPSDGGAGRDPSIWAWRWWVSLSLLGIDFRARPPMDRATDAHLGARTTSRARAVRRARASSSSPTTAPRR